MTEFVELITMPKKTTPSTPAAKPKSTIAVKPTSKTVVKSTAKAAASAKAAKSAMAPAPAPKQAIVTLKQLAIQFGENHDVPAKQAQTMLDGVVSLLVEHLKAGDKLRLNGLGILEVKDRPARPGRNPATGETIQIAANKKIAFRPAKELKEAI